MTSAWCLTNIASGPTIYAKELLRFVPSLHGLLLSSSLSLVEQIIWCFANLAGDSLEFQEVLRHHDIAQAVVDVTPTQCKTDHVISGELSDFRKVVLWCLTNLLRGTPPNDVSPFIDMLPCSILSLKDSNNIIEGAWLLSYITARGSDDVYNRIIQDSNVAIILEVLGQHLISKPAVSLPLLRVIGNICAGPDPYVLKFFQGRTDLIVEMLITVLEQSADDMCKSEACYALANISGTPELATILLKPQLFVVLTNLVSSASFDVKREALALCANLTFSDSRFVLDNLPLSLICPLIQRSRDQRLLSIVLGMFSGLLAREAEAVVKMVECGCLPILIELGESEDCHQAAQASLLVDKYFENYL
ncbi:hypothetical protein GEMRC1_013929 [Eukaryota sp. GEM-RC1]